VDALESLEAVESLLGELDEMLDNDESELGLLVD
jgi:hypothetical protein